MPTLDSSIPRILILIRYWPIIAVLIGMYLLASGWAAILLYHTGFIGAICATRTPWRTLFDGFRLLPALGLWLGGLAAAPAIVLLLPILLPQSPEEIGTMLGTGLEKAGLGGIQFYLFGAYLCLPHPSVEELGWRGMLFVDSKNLHVRDFEFASYHLLVMHFFLPRAWGYFAICLVSLAVMSWIWRRLKMHFGGLAVPTWFHAGGDLGAMLGVWWLIR